ncbi:MAG: N(4)-(beta-N-acetylglucosaminyl)-L-asparaginase [Crocinitomicaceae bacterium]
MKNRREFIKISAIGSAGLLTATSCSGADDTTLTNEINPVITPIRPLVISTWQHGLAANTAAWKILSSGGSALDAVEQGVRITESDPENNSVGIGGLPDRDGHVTLDACIMDHKNQCGSVAFLQGIENPISVARKVMEATPHVMLVGKGAYRFALEQGFKSKDLLTEKSKKRWQKWLKEGKYQPEVNRENHDTIGMLGIDQAGNLSGACTTSGMAFKMHGRVGDSPIIGAGLFVDNEVGAACATGVGESVMRVAGSAMIVELMRHGKSPQKACEEVVQRIVKTEKNLENIQVGFIALNKLGEHGSYAIRKGFNVAIKHAKEEALLDASFAVF